MWRDLSYVTTSPNLGRKKGGGISLEGLGAVFLLGGIISITDGKKGKETTPLVVWRKAMIPTVVTYVVAVPTSYHIVEAGPEPR